MVAGVAVPFLLVQLSDPHIGADWVEADPVARLRDAVAAVRALGPDAVVVTGDLVDHADDAEYERAHELLAAVGAPVHVLPGNHDGRGGLRRRFGLPGDGDEPVQYAVDLGPLRLVALDTTIPGEDAGALDAARLDWLDGALAAAPDAPTVLAMHHPPLATGIAAMDALALGDADRLALGAVVARHPQVRRLIAGHLHRTIAGTLAERSVLVASSTLVQAGLDVRSPGLAFVDEPPGFIVHTLHDGELLSHVQPV